MRSKLSRRKLYIGATVAAVLLYILGSFTFIYWRDNISETMVNTKIARSPVDKTSLSALYTSYVDIVSNDSASSAILELKNNLKRDSVLAGNCHGVAHQIGQAAFTKYGSFAEASQFQDAICNSGYIHGVIESSFKGSENINQAMNTVCAEANKNIYTKWECYHGVGHGVMYFTSNNVPLSVQYCQTLPTTFEVSNCINGVYMENFNAEKSIHPSEYVKDDDYFYPCNMSSMPESDACYYYAPVRYLDTHNQNYEQAFEWCNGAGSYADSCKAGVSGQAVKDNFDDLAVIEDLCLSRPADEQIACIGSAATMVVNMHGGVSEAREFCNNLSDSFKNECLTQVSRDEQQFKTSNENAGVQFRK